jgi:hypothetical protein
MYRILLMFLYILPFTGITQTVDISLGNVMQKRFYDKLDSAQVVISYSSPTLESKVVAFSKDRAGKWKGQMQEVHVIIKGTDTQHCQTTITYYTLTPKADWTSVMTHFYQPNLLYLPGISALNGVTSQIKGHTLNKFTYRFWGKDAVVCEFGEITARADQKQHPELATALEIMKMPDKYFTSKKVKN